MSSEEEPTVIDMIGRLRIVHQRNCERFLTKHHRQAELSDQLKKHAEEVGEFIKAWDGKITNDLVDEYWDSVFSMMATLLNAGAGYNYFSDEEIMLGYLKCLKKIEGRISEN